VADPASLRSTRVLVADDNPEIRQLARIVLERSGCQVTLAGDGVEAMLLMESRPFEVIVTDLFMPGRTGLDVIADARRLQPEARVVAMTGDAGVASVAARAAAAALGVRAFLSKPFPIRDLVALVEGESALPSPAA
jgi:CheY-like chemotaxis protein